ncbi:MAG: PhnD/SsuA/transferrin family substrate-binding protein [Alphaproteobacteria bacterium]|nr:PhnD/SsuA/transferrin family substrate-binding protein [Alphaproteobacteria bacterium]
MRRRPGAGFRGAGQAGPPAGPQGDAPTRRRLLGAALAALSAPPAVRAEEPITLGLTPVFLDSDLALLNAIEGDLSNRLGVAVTLVKRRTYQEILAMLLAGQVTAAWICGFPFVRFRRQLSLLAVPVYKGAPLYEAYFIAASEVPGAELVDFRGRTHAFSDPDSNSGWLVTRHLLAGLGTTPDGFFGRTFFTYGHRNVVRAEAAGLADCGSVDGYVWDVLAEREPALAGKTRTVFRSAPMGFPPIACLSTRRSTRPVAALGAALTGLSGDAAGRRILDLLRLDGFVGADPGLYDSIADRFRSLPS